MKKNIAVIFGGKSAEHDVSIITAHIPIINTLLTLDSYTVWPIYIAKDGTWFCDQRMNAYDFFKDPNYLEVLQKTKRPTISVGNGLSLVFPGAIKKTIHIDLVFPAMHGTFGEDGSLMGLLRMTNTPFVGCDLIASAVAMDKALTKQVLSAEDIPVVPYVWFTNSQWENDNQSLKSKIASLHWPLFVKPVHLGSSIAISKVKTELELTNAIEVALHYDTKVLVEESVENLIEVTLPIMGNETVRFGAIERPLNKTEFFDFTDKYLSGGKKNAGANTQYSELPAKIDVELAKQVRWFGEKAYKTIGCQGIARVDFLIESAAGKIFVNEINTLPGSLYNHNWKSTGVSDIELITSLIAYGEESFLERESRTYAFDSNILTQVHGAKLQS